MLLAFAITFASGSAPMPVQRQNTEAKTALRKRRVPVSGGHSSARSRHVPGPGAYSIDFGTWVDVANGHVLIGRGHEVSWRSSHAYPIHSATEGITAALVSRSGIAFRIVGRDDLYVAAGRGPERRIVRGGWPEGWSASGNLVTVQDATEHGADGAFDLRRADGAFVRTLADGLSGAALDRRFTDADGWFWFWTARGDLVRTDGSSDVRVTNHRALRFRHPPYVWALADDLILLYTDDWRVVVLHRNGALFARASAPTDGSVAGFGDSLMAGPGGRVVVYAFFEVAAPRRTTIFALHQGDTSGTPIFRTREAEWACSPPPVHWMNDRWLLFQHPDGHFSAIDTLGRLRPHRMENQAHIGIAARTPAG